ncbi:sensor histidine kinase [Corallococcus sp. EGB]|uniref:sensor histidine kinase n=1 Tax=Corallococcus sp. EGB TaxID=1521117 RepID=UPI001CBF62CE|nr:histidine kinase [Corallococcus sp. EGB]
MTDTRRLFWKLNLAGWLGYGVVTYTTYAPVLAGMTVERRNAMLVFKALRMGIGFALSLGLHRACRRVRASPLPPWGQALLLFVVCWGLGAVWWLLLRAASSPFFPERTVLDWTWVPHGGLDLGWVFGGWCSIYFGVKSWQEKQAGERARLEARALAHEARLQALRYQLNPHFLFNALNSLRATITEDPGRAQTMVTQLAELLRSTLTGPQQALIPLEQELEGIHSYLALEKVRFEERLQVEWAVSPAAAQALLPALTVQPLVENALKHGARRGAVLHVALRATLEADELCLEVANTGTLRRAADAHAAPASMGIGLRNVQERLAVLFPGRHAFCLEEHDGWVRATLRLKVSHGTTTLSAAGG